MLIPPRLRKLLRLLLEREAPIPVSALAESLGVSRRTVFRELENTGPLLAPYGVELMTKPGAGLLAQGPAEGKQKLLSVLREENTAPADKKERLSRLLLELLRNPELQKIYVYAARFKVSEGTVSNDLETASQWLARYGLSLTRKPGLGIGVEGSESDFRRALIRLLERESGSLETLAHHGFLQQGALEEVCALLRGLHDARLEQMTGDSQARLALYLAVVTERVQAGRTFTGDAQAPGPLALRLADTLEERFGVSLSPAERGFLQVLISGARMRHPDACQQDAQLDHYELQRLACRMIDRFDTNLAYELKRDEALVKGLAFHLQSAVVRLQHGLELTDPLMEQMRESYPEVFEKSQRAAQVLREEYGTPVSDSEAGFLSMHFGAGVMRLRQSRTHKRTVLVGVLCVNGIGVSYMMASQIKARFQDAVEAQVCLRADLDGQNRFDFCVSAVPLEAASMTVIETKPILDAADLERIGAEIARCASDRGSGSPATDSGGFAERMQRLEWMARDVRTLLEQFQVARVETDSTFSDLVKLAGYRFGNSPENGRHIYEDLMDRERISTQVVEEYGFVLLHARTRGVAQPVFALLCPETAPFSEPYLQGTHCAVVMLAPEAGNPDQGRMMGAISSALVEDAAFLAAVRRGNAEETRAGLEALLRTFLAETIKRLIGSV